MARCSPGPPRPAAPGGLRVSELPSTGGIAPSGCPLLLRRPRGAINRPSGAALPQGARHRAGVWTSLEASRRAEATGAFTESIRFLEIARDNMRTPERSAEIISRLAHLKYLHRDLSAAAPLLAVASRSAREIGDLRLELGQDRRSRRARVPGGGGGRGTIPGRWDRLRRQ